MRVLWGQTPVTKLIPVLLKSHRHRIRNPRGTKALKLVVRSSLEDFGLPMGGREHW